MNYRCLLPILGLLALPVSAEELQVDIQGAASSNIDGSNIGTFDLSFDINTLGGQDSYQVAPSGNLITFRADSLAITDLSASLNGVSVLSLPTAVGGMGGDSVDSNHSTMFAFVTAPGFVWNIDVGSPTVISNAADPLLGFLTRSWVSSYPASTVGLDSFSGDQLVVKIAPVGVPEPALAALMLLGLAGVALSHRRRLLPLALR